MARESVHDKLSRVRPPRVHVTYNVEIGNAIELKEIPFVMGVFADLSGMPEDPLPPAQRTQWDSAFLPKLAQRQPATLPARQRAAHLACPH